MAVKAWLVGHSFDLDTLAALFHEGDPQVASDDEGHYLTSPALNDLLNDGGQLYETAASLLRRTNGVARALDIGFRPVALLGRFSDSSGALHLVVQAETVEARAQAFAIAAEGDQPWAASRGPAYVHLAKDHPDVAEVLEVLGTSPTPLTWIDLYKIYEIVAHNVGNEAKLKEKDWVSSAELTAFTASANRADVSGSEARHARNRGGLPKRTMTPDEGRAFIGRLVASWWDSMSIPS